MLASRPFRAYSEALGLLEALAFRAARGYKRLGAERLKPWSSGCWIRV